MRCAWVADHTTDEFRLSKKPQERGHGVGEGAAPFAGLSSEKALPFPHPLTGAEIADRDPRSRAVHREPDYFGGHLRLASLYGLTDRIEFAKAELDVALKINPRFMMSMADAFYGSTNAASTLRFKRGLSRAGLPE